MTATSGGSIDSINLYVANVAGRLNPHLETIEAAFSSASGRAHELLGADRIDVLVVDAPDEAIVEWGIGGSTWGPHLVVVALDPDVEIASNLLEQTLLHEYHHAMRWRGPGCGDDLHQMLVSEGLAQLFEVEVLGVEPFYCKGPVRDDEIALAESAMHDRPVNTAKWFFGADGVTRSFGYAYGYRVCAAYAQATGARASELVDVAADVIVPRPLD